MAILSEDEIQLEVIQPTVQPYDPAIHKLVPGADLSNIDFSDCLEDTFYEKKLTDANFTGSTFKNIRFTRTTLDGAIFENARCDNVEFYQLSMNKVKFRNAKLKDVEFDVENANESNFQGVWAENLRIISTNIKLGVIYGGALLPTRFTCSDFTGAKLSGKLEVTEIDFTGSVLCISLFPTEIMDDSKIAYYDGKPMKYTKFSDIVAIHNQLKTYYKDISNQQIIILSAAKIKVFELLREREKHSKDKCSGIDGSLFQPSQPSLDKHSQKWKLLESLRKKIEKSFSLNEMLGIIQTQITEENGDDPAHKILSTETGTMGKIFSIFHMPNSMQVLLECQKIVLEAKNNPQMIDLTPSSCYPIKFCFMVAQ